MGRSYSLHRKYITHGQILQFTSSIYNTWADLNQLHNIITMLCFVVYFWKPNSLLCVNHYT